MRKLLLALIFLLCASTASAATYYIDDNGNDSSGDGTEANPWQSIRKAFAKPMVGGDTLIMKNGYYTGINNNITTAGTDYLPPAGNATNYTIIRGESMGGVIIDGQDTMDMFRHELVKGSATVAKYWQFENLTWKNFATAGVHLNYASYIKFIRCGMQDPGGGGCGQNFRFGEGCDYVLAENCYAWGTGRFQFIAHQADHIIFRQCVARKDQGNFWCGSKAEVIALYAMYSVANGIVQNCIAIDSDQRQAWSNFADMCGAFANPGTDAWGYNISYRQCLGLNLKLGTLNVAGETRADNPNPGNNTETFGYVRSDEVNFDNCTFWDTHITAADYGGSRSNLFLLGQNTSMHHCTIGKGSSDFRQFYSKTGGLNNAGFNTTIANSIIYDTHAGTLMYNIDSHYYNNHYNNTGSYYLTGANGGTNATTNPIWSAGNPNGPLKYITRVETGSTNDNAGSDGGDVGANLRTLVGTSGTLWGQTGFDTDTGVSMWPFPNEDAIRTAMRSYNEGGVSGARGFCANGKTLTTYIWEYLGNTIPADIYGDATLEITTDYIANSTTGTTVNKAITTTGANGTVTYGLESGTLMAGTTFNTTNGWINGTYNTSGWYNFTINATDAGAAYDNQSYSVYISAPAGLRIITTEVPEGENGSYYEVQLSCENGTGNWSTSAGTLPTNTSLSNFNNTATVTLSGWANTTETGSFTLRVENVTNDTQAYNFVINPPPANSSVYSQTNSSADYSASFEHKYEITVPNLANRTLWVATATEAHDVVGLNWVKYGSQNMTRANRLKYFDNNATIDTLQVWQLSAPAVGTANVTINATMTTPTWCALRSLGIVLFNTKQQNPEVLVNATSINTTFGSSITTVSNNSIIIDIVSNVGGTLEMTPASGQTELCDIGDSVRLGAGYITKSTIDTYEQNWTVPQVVTSGIISAAFGTVYSEEEGLNLTEPPERGRAHSNIRDSNVRLY